MNARRHVAVVGPSGAGKDTLISLACAARPDLRAARRVVTRPAEAGGEDFEGVAPEDFALRLAQGGFALRWRAHGLDYGIPVGEFEAPGTILFNASRAVLPEARRLFPALIVVLVTAPPEILARRLAGRGRETPEDQRRRLARADLAASLGPDLREVVNDSTPEAALARFLAALQPESA